MQDKLKEWSIRLHEAQTGHYAQTEKYNKFDNILGVPLVIGSSFVSAFLFFENTNETVNCILKSTGLLVVIFASLQTYIRPAEKAEMHRVKAAKYGALKREIEAFLVQDCDIEKSVHFIEEVTRKWNSIAEDSPVTPNAIRKKIGGLLDNFKYQEKKD